MTDTTEGTEVEETYEPNEQGVAYSSESAPSDDAPARPATIAPAAATASLRRPVAAAGAMVAGRCGASADGALSAL